MSDTPRQVDQSCVYLWLPNGTYDFTIGVSESPDVQPSDGYRRHIDADIMPSAFGLTGIWEDCVKGGTPLDKCRQFESLLARNPDVICVTGGQWKDIPAKYKLEILRRVQQRSSRHGQGRSHAERARNSVLPAGQGQDPERGRLRSRMGPLQARLGLALGRGLRDALRDAEGPVDAVPVGFVRRNA